MKILIANRGEIACRIINTLKQLNILSVAIYSAVDAQNLFVRLADEAYYVGEAPSQASYLQQETIIRIARDAGVTAIHPGYGFLSENAEFAKRCEDNNITFIGPTSEVIALMGDKQRAKQLMQQANIATIPGYQGKQQNIDELYAQALNIGFPLMIKASAGGGGKGMRLIHSADELKSALASAKREALASFANDKLILEKYLINARHIEVQLLGDKYGNVLYLFDRDCSIQRRHQKIIEEAPAPNIPDSIRQEMAKVAKQAARLINYHGAGTIEFLLDDAGQFYFMEMNTRLQVEHAVTEKIGNIDIVAWQIHIANNQPLTFAQDDLQCQGHAIEVRIYAEDPLQNFMPTIGRIDYLQFPNCSAQLRIDTSIELHDEISVYYDPLLAKLIVWQANRELAIQHLQQNLTATQIVGVTTNLGLLYRITREADFITAKISTEFIENHRENLLKLEASPPLITIIAAGISRWRQQLLDNQRYLHQNNNANSPWLCMDGWQQALPAHIHISLWQEENYFSLDLHTKQSTYQFTWQERTYELQIRWHGDRLQLTLDQCNYHFLPTILPPTIIIFHEGEAYTFNGQYPNPDHQLAATNLAEGLNAPMPGIITQICVTIGTQVHMGDPLIILEAMKMEHTLHAPYDGIVSAIYFSVGERATKQSPLLAVEKTYEISPL